MTIKFLDLSKINKPVLNASKHKIIKQIYSGNYILDKNKKKITKARLKVWQAYKDFCSEHDFINDCFETQTIPKNTQHNGHLFYLLFRNKKYANKFNLGMRNMGIETAKHYVALHSSSFGKKNSRHVGTMINTNRASECSVRLPIWEGINVEKVLNSMKKVLKAI